MINEFTVLLGIFVFDPVASVRALGHDDARPGALRQILRLDAVELSAARGADLAGPVAALVPDPKVPVADRILAARVLALLARPEAVPALADQAGRDASPEDVAVARESALALRQMSATDALVPLLAARDPEVRATAAAAGANPERLCALAREDAWPAVRAAAARGLTHHADRAACLADALTDADAGVALTAARTLAETRSEAAHPALRRVAGDAQADVPLRREAVIALGRLGDLEPAEKILAKHLADGAIVPLAEAAVEALAAARTEASAAQLRRALGSAAPSVQRVAARALATRDDAESRAALDAFLQKLPPNERRGLQAREAEEPRGPDAPDDDADE
jgi:HEAT repeat protein